MKMARTLQVAVATCLTFSITLLSTTSHAVLPRPDPMGFTNLQNTPQPGRNALSAPTTPQRSASRSQEAKPEAETSDPSGEAAQQPDQETQLTSPAQGPLQANVMPCPPLGTLQYFVALPDRRNAYFYGGVEGLSPINLPGSDHYYGIYTLAENASESQETISTDNTHLENAPEEQETTPTENLLTAGASEQEEAIQENLTSRDDVRLWNAFCFFSSLKNVNAQEAMTIRAVLNEVTQGRLDASGLHLSNDATKSILFAKIKELFAVKGLLPTIERLLIVTDPGSGNTLIDLLMDEGFIEEIYWELQHPFYNQHLALSDVTNDRKFLQSSPFFQDLMRLIVRNTIAMGLIPAMPPTFIDILINHPRMVHLLRHALGLHLNDWLENDPNDSFVATSKLANLFLEMPYLLISNLSPLINSLRENQETLIALLSRKLLAGNALWPCLNGPRLYPHQGAKDELFLKLMLQYLAFHSYLPFTTEALNILLTNNPSMPSMSTYFTEQLWTIPYFTASQVEWAQNPDQQEPALRALANALLSFLREHLPYLAENLSELLEPAPTPVPPRELTEFTESDDEGSVVPDSEPEEEEDRASTPTTTPASEGAYATSSSTSAEEAEEEDDEEVDENGRPVRRLRLSRSRTLPHPYRTSQRAHLSDHAPRSNHGRGWRGPAM